jgi:hypothetical protein
MNMPVHVHASQENKKVYRGARAMRLQVALAMITSCVIAVPTSIFIFCYRRDVQVKQGGLVQTHPNHLLIASPSVQKRLKILEQQE